MNPGRTGHISGRFLLSTLIFLFAAQQVIGEEKTTESNSRRRRIRFYGTTADAAKKLMGEKVTFYVAPYGDDDNLGSEDMPFATLSRAQDAVRTLKRVKKARTVYEPEADIAVLIRGGTYALTEPVVFGLEDSGTERQVITYAAYPGEEPVFTSGVRITGWQKLTDPPSALSEIARDKVWVADIPETKGGKWRFFSLFDGDRMLPRARSAGFQPEEDERSYFGRGFWGMTFAPNDRKSLLLFPKGTIRNWSNLEDVEVVIFPGVPYTVNILGLKSVDEEKREALTTIPATYAMNTIDWYVNPVEKEDGPLRMTSAWVENMLEALDEPGEWVLNTQQGRLYLWPTRETPGDNIFAPRLKELIRVEGEVDMDGPKDMPVRYLVFRDLTFTQGDRDLWTIDDAGIQHDWEMYDKSTALLRFRATEHCTVDQCRFTSSGGTGVRFDLHSQYNKVQRCLFENLGQSGVLICGYGPGTKDVSFRNQVLENHIHDLGKIYAHSHGIILWQSGENLVARNLIHDMPRKAISCSGARTAHFNPEYKDTREVSKMVRWHEVDEVAGYDAANAFRHVRNNVIEYNEVYRIFGKGEDGGGINITGSAEGNIIRGNYLHDITNPMADAAIRLDGTGRGTLITGNIIYNCALPAINARDKNNYIENNIMIDCSKKRRKDQEGFFMFGPEGSDRFMRNVLYSSGEKTPFLLRLEDAKLSQYKSDYNLFYSAAKPGASEEFLKNLQEEGTDRNSISADPLFVDFDNQDFRLKPDSPMFERGFKQIDTDKIGLTKDFPEHYK